MAVEVTAKRFLSLSSSAPTFATVGVASAVALTRSATRRGAIFVNTSTNRISFGIGQAAVLDRGITIYGNGGVWEMDEHSFTIEAIHAIASGAGSNLTIQEWS